MSRVIKFRAWDIRNEVMWLRKPKQLVSEFFQLIEQDIDGGEQFILMQFTGLLDKNGKEIYEGDQVEQDGGLRGVIIFYGGCFCWENKDTTMTELTHFGDGRHFTVIGNIYEKS